MVKVHVKTVVFLSTVNSSTIQVIPNRGRRTIALLSDVLKV